MQPIKDLKQNGPKGPKKDWSWYIKARNNWHTQYTLIKEQALFKHKHFPQKDWTCLNRNNYKTVTWTELKGFHKK